MMNIEYKIFCRFLAIFAVTFGFFAPGFAAEQSKSTSNTIQSVDYSNLPGGRVLVKVGFKQEPTQAPAAFTTATPPRITLDFVNAGSGLAKKSINVGEGLLRSINAAEAGNRTRLVLNLNVASTYTTAIEGNNVLITLLGAAVSNQSAAAVTHFNQSAVAAKSNQIKAIDFQRGKNGEGRVVVDMEEGSTAIDIRQQGKNLVVDFLDSQVPENLERRLNVTNFATPVLTVDTFKQGQNARLVIEPKGEWEHSAYQMDHRFIVEIKPIVFDPSKVVQGTKAGFGGDKLSLDFNNIDVKSLLRIIGDFTGKNVVVSENVQGTITLRLKDVPWDQALDIIMKQKSLGMDNLGNTLVFAPKAEFAARQKEAQDQENQIDEIKPLITQSFMIKYQKATDIKVLVSDPKQPLLSKRGSAVVDPLTNTLFVKDIDSSLLKIQEVLNKVDIPARQVLIESRVVIADKDFQHKLGARFGVQKQGPTLNSSGSIGNGAYIDSSSIKFPDPTTSHTDRNKSYGSLALGKFGSAYNKVNTIGSASDLNVDLPVVGAAGSLALSLFRLPAGLLLNMELSAMEQDNKGTVISSPRVATTNGKEAYIRQGVEIPYQTVSTSGTKTEFRTAALSLRVTPQITPDNKINMELEVTKDSPGDATPQGMPTINTQSAKTQVLVENGETAVLGGVYEQEVRNDVTRVPFFGNLPIVGPLFKTTSKIDGKKELLIFVTPKVVDEATNLK